MQGYLCAALPARAELADAFGDRAQAAELRDRADCAASSSKRSGFPKRAGMQLLWTATNVTSMRLAATSNCLWTGIATDEHAAEIIKRLANEEMNCGFGLRTLASTVGAYTPMSYHNGSVWPHDTAIAVAATACAPQALSD